MSSSPSRTTRPRALWGTALLGATLTFVAPTLAQDAAESPAKKGAPKAEKPTGMKKANEAKESKKAGTPGEKGEKAAGQDKGAEANKMALKKRADKSGKPDKKAKKKHPPVSRRAAVSDYKKAVLALQEAQKASKSDDPTAAKKASLERARAMKELHQAKRKLRRANSADAKKLKSMSPAERQKIESKLQARAKQLAEDRKERAEKNEEAVKKDLGDKVKLAPVRAELERHAWRVARLERLIAIAEASGRVQTAARAKQLLDKENAAHPERLKKAAGEKSAASDKASAAGGMKTNVAAPVAKTATVPQPKPAAPPAKPAAPAPGGAQ